MDSARKVEAGSTAEKKVAPPRANTYLPQELFKTVLIAPTKERAEGEAGWLTGAAQQRGFFACNHLKTKLAVFCRWPGMPEKQTSTVAVEALIVYINSQSEWEEVKAEVMKFSTIPVRVIVTDKNNNVEEAQKELNATLMEKPADSKTMRIDLDKLDRVEFQRIKDKFEQFDEDGSGNIESSEMAKVAISLGIDPNNQDFIESLYALDLNGDGEISLTEFITWWKVGRQNTTSLPKIYHLNEYIKTIMTKWFNLANFVEENEEIKKLDISRTRQTIYFKSPGEYQLKTFIEASIAFGGPKRQQEAENFLRRFTTNVGSQKMNWISVLFSLGRKNRISGDRAKAHLEHFKEICLKWAEAQGMAPLVSFLRNLLIFETSNTENSVIMAIRLKADIEELVKAALGSISKIVDCLSTSTESAFLSVKAHSNEDIFDAINEPKTVFDFFKVSELRINSTGFRRRLKSFFSNISKEKVDVMGMLQFLFVPYSLDLSITGDLSDITDPTQKALLDTSLSSIGFFMNFLKQNIAADLLKAADDIDIAFNAFDLFFHVKFYSEKMFSG